METGAGAVHVVACHSCDLSKPLHVEELVRVLEKHLG